MPGSHHHFSLQEASNTWGTFYKYYTEHGANYTWSSPIYRCLHSPRVLRWMEKRWLPGVLKAPGQATADDALAYSVSWESNNSQNTKNVPPSAGGDQPMHPAAKHSLCTGKPSDNSSVLLPPVNQNGLRCSQQWSQIYHLSEVPHKPSVRLKLSFILMKATLRRGRVITAFLSVKCPKRGTRGNPKQLPCSERHCDCFKCFQSKKALQTDWLQQNFVACFEKKWNKESMLVAWPEDTSSKKPQSSAICCGVWTAADRVRAVSFAYSRDAKQYWLSAFLESALEYFESSKTLFKRFSSHCSTVRRLIN